MYVSGFPWTGKIKEFENLEKIREFYFEMLKIFNTIDFQNVAILRHNLWLRLIMLPDYDNKPK